MNFLTLGIIATNFLHLMLLLYIIIELALTKGRMFPLTMHQLITRFCPVINMDQGFRPHKTKKTQNGPFALINTLSGPKQTMWTLAFKTLLFNS